MREIGSCCFCGHTAHGPGGCDNCPPKRRCNAPPSYAARILGRRGGLKGGRATGASKVRGDSAHYRALRAKAKPKTYAATLNGQPVRVTIPED